MGTANAVNLTDGLDGLAIGPVTITAAIFMILCYLAGNKVIAADPRDSRISVGWEELAVLLGALVGAGIGFLWYNSYPAQVFMGDVGALALGGVLGTVSLATKQEFLLAIAGGIFVVEALSVILPGLFFQGVQRQTHLSHGPPAPSLRTEGVAGAQGDRPLLDFCPLSWG